MKKYFLAFLSVLLGAIYVSGDVVYDFSTSSEANRHYLSKWATNIRNRKIVDGVLCGTSVKHPAYFSIDKVDLPLERAQLLVIEMKAEPGSKHLQVNANLQHPSATYENRKLITDGKYHTYVFDFENFSAVKYSKRLYNYRINPIANQKSSKNFAIRSIRLMPKKQHLPGVSAVVPKAPQKLTVPEFFQLTAGGKAKAPTSIDVSYTEEGLYIEFKSAIDNVSYRAAAKERDGAVYSDDCFDIAIKFTPDSFYQIAFNPMGVVFDQKITYSAYLKKGEKKTSFLGRGDKNWNSTVKVKNNIRPGWWTGSIMIPWKDFNLAALPEDLYINVVRVSKASPMGVCGWNYSPIRAYADPVNFRHLILQESASARVTYTRSSMIKPGDDTIQFANPDRRKLEFKLEVRDLNTGKSTFFKSVSNNEQENLKYQLNESSYELLVTVYENNRMIFFDAFSANTALFRKKFAAAYNSVKNWQTNTPEAAAIKAKLLAEGKKLTLNADFAAMDDYIKQTSEDYRRIQLSALYSAALKNFKRDSLPFALGQASSADKVFRMLDADIPYFPVRALDKLNIYTAKNELEGVQLVLIGLDKKVEDLKIKLVKNPSGKAPQLKLSGVDFLDTRKAIETKYPVSYRGEWPDVLSDDLPGKLAPYEVRSVWFKAETPADMPAGTYEYLVEISARGLEKPVQVPLTVTVWDFALPAVPTLRTAMSNLYTFNIRYFERIRGTRFNRKEHQEINDMMVRFFLKNKMNPGHIYTMRHITNKLIEYPDLNRLAEYRKLGLNAVPAVYLPQGSQSMNCADMMKKYYNERIYKNLLSVVKRTYDIARKQNMQDVLYVYAFDEIFAHLDKKNKMQALSEIVKNIRKVAPEAKIMCIAETDPSLIGVVDIWVPSIKMMSTKTKSYHDRKKAGDELWLYTCLGAPGHVPGEPPSFVLEESAAAMRLVGWMCYYYEAEGFLYYSMHNWLRNSRKGAKPFPHESWNIQYVSGYNGEAVLLYPAKDHRLEPLSSIRFENLRDGFEDFEYFTMLANAAKKHKLSGKDAAEVKALLEMKDLVRGGADYTDDSAKILEHRRKMAEWIVRLNKMDK